jgi:hypothetical protein
MEWGKILLSITVSLNILMGLYVTVQKTKKISHWLFVTLVLTSAIWTCMNFVADFSSSGLFLRLSYSLGAVMIALGYAWVEKVSQKTN